MSLLCLRTHNLSWQDRTVNIELMMAPTRSQLLYNKHKGLATKYEQEFTNLEREKASFLRSYKTELRMMERRKDRYSRRRSDILVTKSPSASRSASAASRQSGRTSAPPRLQEGQENENKTNGIFVTQLPGSAGPTARMLRQVQSSQRSRLPSKPDAVPEQQVQRSISAKTPMPGKPFLERQKSVRFTNGLPIKEDPKPEVPKQLTINERIQRFIDTQYDFNAGRYSAKSRANLVNINNASTNTKDNVSAIQRRQSVMQLNMLKLQTAFDEFCEEKTPENFQHLVKFASRMKVKVKNSRRSTSGASMDVSKPQST